MLLVVFLYLAICLFVKIAVPSHSAHVSEVSSLPRLPPTMPDPSSSALGVPESSSTNSPPTPPPSPPLPPPLPPFLSSFPPIHPDPTATPLASRLRRALHRAVVERRRMFPLVRSFETRLRSYYGANMRLMSELFADRARVLALEKTRQGIVGAPMQEYVTLTRALQHEASQLRASSIDLNRRVESERATAEDTCVELRAAFLPFLHHPQTKTNASLVASRELNRRGGEMKIGTTTMATSGNIFLQTSLRALEKQEQQQRRQQQQHAHRRQRRRRHHGMLRSPLVTSRVTPPPPSVTVGDLAPAEDIIRTIRETSQRLFLRTRPQRNLTTPPRHRQHSRDHPPHHDFAPVRAELKWHCAEAPGSLFHAFRMLNVDHRFDANPVFVSTNKLAKQVEHLARVVETLNGIQADDKLVLRQNLSESARANALGVRRQDENALHGWLQKERESEHRRVASFNPTAPDRCTLTCRRKIRARILSLSSHVSGLQSRREQHFNDGDTSMTAYYNDNNNISQTSTESLHRQRNNNSGSTSETTSCAVHQSCESCIADSACGFCEAAGLFGRICTEGVPQGPVFVPCQLGAKWHHGLDSKSRFCPPSSSPHKTGAKGPQHSVGMPTKNEAQETDINERVIVPSAVSETKYRDSVHTSTGNETVPFSPASYKVSRLAGHSPALSTEAKDFIPFYPGADDVRDNMHWEGQRGAISSLWNALNQPCDGFGWTPSECEVGKRLSLKEGLADAIYASSSDSAKSSSSSSSSTTTTTTSENNSDSSSGSSSSTVTGGRGIAQGSYPRATSPPTSSSYTSSSREESSETKLYNGKRSAGGSKDPIGPEPVPLTINHVFPLENDEGLSGTIGRQGDQAVDASSVLGGGGAGTEDLVISVGSSVDARWNSGCMFEPARVSAVNPDGTFDLLYASGKTESRVDSRSMKTRGVVGSSACRAEGCVVVHGGGCGSGPWPKKVPTDAMRVALANTLAEKGGKCKTNRDCQSGLLCDPTRKCVEVNVAALDPRLGKVIDPFGDAKITRSPGQSRDEGGKGRDVTAAILASGQGKPGGAGAPPCIPLKGVWPPKCTPTSELSPKILGVKKLGSITKLNPADPFPHGSFSSPAEEKAVGDLTKAIAAAGLSGKVAEAMGEGLKKAAKKDAAGKSQKTSKGEKWRKQVFGPVGTAEEGGEHIKPGVGRIAPIGNDPDKKGQTGMEPCKGLPHGLCSFVTTCCWFSAPSFLDDHDHQGECRGVGSCDWSKPPPGSPDPGSGKGGKPGPGLGNFPGKPLAPDPDGAGNGGPGDKGASPPGRGEGPGPGGSPTKPGQGEDPNDTAKAVDLLADFVGRLGVSAGRAIAKTNKGASGSEEGHHAGPLEQLLGQENPESGELETPSAQMGDALSSDTPNPESGSSSAGMPCRSDSDCALSEMAARKDTYICSEMRICEKNLQPGSESKGGEGAACGGNDGAQCREPFSCSARGQCSVGADIGSVCGHGNDETCRPGLVCKSMGRCGAPAKLGDACSRDDQCSGMLQCSGAGACVMNGGLNAPCSDANACSPGLMCEPDKLELSFVCKSQVGSPCQRNADCGAHALCSTHSNVVSQKGTPMGHTKSSSGGGSGSGGDGGGGSSSEAPRGFQEADGSQVEEENEVDSLEKSGARPQPMLPNYASRGGGRRGLSPKVRVDVDARQSPRSVRQEPIAIDKETGEPYYAKALIPSTLLLNVKQKRAEPTTVFDVGQNRPFIKCGPTCRATRRQRLCKDLIPFCGWLVTPPSRLSLCASHPVEAIARFAIPARFCSFFVRVSRHAHVLVGKEGCRFDPRNDPVAIQRACRYLDVQRPLMCHYCEVEREDMHDTDIEIIRVLQDLHLNSNPADENSPDSPSMATTTKRLDNYQPIEGEITDPTMGSCIINPRLTNTSVLNVDPSEDECCQCGPRRSHGALLEIKMRGGLSREAEPHLLNTFGDPLRLSNRVGAHPQTQTSTPRPPSARLPVREMAPQECCPCVGGNSLDWGDAERGTNVAAVDTDISNLSAKYAEESSIIGLRGPTP